MATSAFAFFANGGRLLRVVRVVPTDATAATAYLSEDVVAESLTADTATKTPTFVAFTGANGTNKTPIAPDTVTLTVTSGGTGLTTALTDNGLGVLTNGTVSGTIDYETGEITITGVSGSTLSTATFAITYQYKTFTFDMEWAGASGNNIGVFIQGDPNYQDIATASFTRFIVAIVNTATNATLESYDAVSFTDSSSANFIATVLNDASTGSKYVTVITEGNNEAPSAFFGTQISSENLIASPVYDGATRSFTYTLNNGVSPFSLTGEVEFEQTVGPLTLDTLSFVVSNTGILQRNLLTYTFPAATYGLLMQDLAAGRIQISDVRTALDTMQVVVSATPTTGPNVFADQTLVYDATGDTFTIVPATGSTLVDADIVAASSGINYVAGNIVLTISLSPVGGGSADPEFNPSPAVWKTGSATLPVTYSLGTILIADDGEGNIVDLGTGTAVNIALDSSGAVLNVIDYGTLTSPAELSLTWRFGENPSRGPAAYVGQTVDYYTVSGVASATVGLSGGTDGSALSRSVVSAPALSADSKGLYALNNVEEILNICIPDFETDPLVSGDLIDYCETRKDRFAVISVPQGLDNNQAVNYKKQTLAKNSSRAAIYYPHVRISDPLLDGAETLHPAGGHMLGILARTDVTANVSTAPAGTTRGILAFSVGLEFKMTPEQAGVTNQASVNNLVEWPYTGRVVWGARTLQVGGEFPYIQMRRLFIYLEKSVFNSTQQFVFENNGAALQARVRVTVESFMLNLYNAGYFSGTTPAQAFFVICDSSNNTPTQIAQGILTCDIGVAPTRPAEFVVFRFQQKSLGV
jgi:hypothetical protein